MIPSCCPWKVVTFFGKEHVNWSSINGVMIGRSLNIKFGKLKIGVTKKKWIFPNLIFQLHPIITQLILNQFACSLPKTNTTFHQLFKYVKKEEIFSSIRGENSRNIFGPCSMRGTVVSDKCPASALFYHSISQLVEQLGGLLNLYLRHMHQ